MLRSALAPFLASALALSVAAPAQAEESEPIGNVNVVIGGVAFGQFTYPLEAGKTLTVQRHVLDPGEIITWNGAATYVAMHGNEEGDLTNFPNCNSQQTWRAYPAYYVARSKAAGTLTGVTANTSTVAIEFYTVKSEAIGAPQTDAQLHREPTSPQAGDVIAGEEPNPGGIGDPVTAAGGCPKGAEGETTKLASGVMGTSEGIDLTDHTQIVDLPAQAPGRLQQRLALAVLADADHPGERRDRDPARLQRRHRAAGRPGHCREGPDPGEEFRARGVPQHHLEHPERVPDRPAVLRAGDAAAGLPGVCVAAVTPNRPAD